MASFNATQVALERMAGIFTDLPLGLDERQLAGTKQEFLEKLVYMLAEGRGRARGSKSGELQEMQTWRSIIIATGEEPIIEDSSQTGVSTRMIEVVGAPFDNEADAAAMHRNSCINFGHAGPRFIKYILRMTEETINDRYKKMFEMVKDMGGGMDANQLNYVALIAVADVMVDKLLFNPERSEMDCMNETAIMVGEVLQAMSENDIRDVDESACDFIADWINLKKRNFSMDTNQDFYGVIDEETVYVIPSVLKEALESGGYSYRKTMKGLAEKNVILQDRQGRNSVVKRLGGKVMRMVAIDLDALLGDKPNNDDGFGSEVQNLENPFS